MIEVAGLKKKFKLTKDHKKNKIDETHKITTANIRVYLRLIRCYQKYRTTFGGF